MTNIQPISNDLLSNSYGYAIDEAKSLAVTKEIDIRPVEASETTKAEEPVQPLTLDSTENTLADFEQQQMQLAETLLTQDLLADLRIQPEDDIFRYNQIQESNEALAAKYIFLHNKSINLEPIHGLSVDVIV